VPHHTRCPWASQVSSPARLGPGRISLFGPLGRAAVRQQPGPTLVAPEGLQTQQSVLPGRSLKLAGPMERTRILLAARLHRPQPSHCFHRCVLRSSLRSWCSSKYIHPTGPLFPARRGPLPARVPSAPTSTRGDGRRPVGKPASTRRASHSGGKPPHSMRCRDSPRRLRGHEAFGRQPALFPRRWVGWVTKQKSLTPARKNKRSISGTGREIDFTGVGAIQGHHSDASEFVAGLGNGREVLKGTNDCLG